MAVKKLQNPKLTFEIGRYPQPSGRFYWVAETVNKTVVATSSKKGYGRRRDCLSSIATLVKHIKAKSFAITEA
jgi:hypothetical protein